MKRVVGRAADVRLRGWIDRRIKGETALKIAADSGVPAPQVIQSTNAVRKDDIEESAKSGENVAGFYW